MQWGSTGRLPTHLHPVPAHPGGAVVGGAPPLFHTCCSPSLACPCRQAPPRQTSRSLLLAVSLSRGNERPSALSTPLLWRRKKFVHPAAKIICLFTGVL